MKFFAILLVLAAVLWAWNSSLANGGEWKAQSDAQDRSALTHDFTTMAQRPGVPEDSAEQRIRGQLLGKLNASDATWTVQSRAENEARKGKPYHYVVPDDSPNHPENRFPDSNVLHHYFVLTNESDRVTSGYRLTADGGASSHAPITLERVDLRRADAGLMPFLQLPASDRVLDFALEPLNTRSDRTADYTKDGKALPYRVRYLVHLDGTKLTLIATDAEIVVGKKLYFTQGGFPTAPYWGEDVRQVAPSAADRKRVLDALIALVSRG